MTSRFSTLKHSITDVIGGTPLLELHNIARSLNLRGRMLAKLEYLNPGLSKKDRIALEMVKHAKEKRLLKDGQTVVELTSGNTGTGLAIVDGARRALAAGSLLLIERGEAHEIRNTGRTPLKTLNFYAPPAYTAGGNERPAGRPPRRG